MQRFLPSFAIETQVRARALCVCVRVVLFDTRKSYFLKFLDSSPFFQKKRLDWVLKNFETLNSRSTKIVFSTRNGIHV